MTLKWLHCCEAHPRVKQNRFDNGILTGLTAAFLVALVKTVGQSIALPPTWDTLPISAHEVSRDVALSGEVVPWEQLAL